ncbi:RNA polymerase sigma-70 factor [Sphingobacterium alkalisoli]|uniref:RNA polymerase sigma-70 factor n=1 Tax=Sphingobacterium alkalisoli TaxID=1874115 RepID=A0A4U0GSI6_9SPHI|nr:RNA polymerase sigma-70 factor [Sphingobacterium alkalisoli]TJY61424.1 RNA polymerase sigma-70 factor [Sphingobacterium alkalisoli]GGH30475.1 RNA polymerase sigma-70 factor [Sphingobacterium alkalisoli]
MSAKDFYQEDELANALVGGSEEAFATIYDRYWKILLGLAYKHTHDKMVAEEIVQEVFVSLWRRRTEVKIDTISSYLATAVKFATFKQIQRTRRQQEIRDAVLPVDTRQLDEEYIDARFLQEFIDGLVEKLPEKCQLIFRLSREEHKTNKEISSELNVTEKAVEAQITRALKTLRVNLRKVGFSLFFLLLF